jgi:uncharacterized membrane protein
MKTINMMQHEVVILPSNIMILGVALAIVIGILTGSMTCKLGFYCRQRQKR